MKSEIQSVEWPTLGLLGMNYALWCIVVLNYQHAPLLCATTLCFVLTLQSSLVHELIHGHPTRYRWVNAMMGMPPITMIYPYHLFEETHLKHHNDEFLTEPEEDPESFFCRQHQWQQKSSLARAASCINMTLAGRLLLSVPASLIQVFRYFLRQSIDGNHLQRWSWFWHVSGLVLIFWFLIRFSEMPLWVYAICAAIGHMVIALRAFFEHRPAPDPDQRIVIVESNWLFQLLYLGNNFHAVHHRYPHLPWYRIAETYRSQRDEILCLNNQFHYKGYFDWLRFLFKPVHSPIHPVRNAARRS